MNKLHVFQTCLLASLVMGLLAFARHAHGEVAKANCALSETNLVPADPPAPQSVFDLSRPYKDPFFPNSTRSKRTAIVSTNIAAAFSVDEFVLKGISGVPGSLLAIINNRNLAAGERGQVTLPSGANVWITVVAVYQYSAVIIPDGARVPLTISLPKDDQ
jgi:hypothetical protein